MKPKQLITILLILIGLNGYSQEYDVDYWDHKMFIDNNISVLTVIKYTYNKRDKLKDSSMLN